VLFRRRATRWTTDDRPKHDLPRRCAPPVPNLWRPIKDNAFPALRAGPSSSGLHRAGIGQASERPSLGSELRLFLIRIVSARAVRVARCGTCENRLLAANFGREYDPICSSIQNQTAGCVVRDISSRVRMLGVQVERLLTAVISGDP
jgi:hypothetical protein